MDPGEKIPANTQGMDEFMAEIFPLRPTPNLIQDPANWFKTFLEDTEKAEREITEHVTGIYEDEKILPNRDRTPRKERNIVEDEKELTASRLALWSGRLDELIHTVVKKSTEPGGKGLIDSEEYRGHLRLFESKVSGFRNLIDPTRPDSQSVKEDPDQPLRWTPVRTKDQHAEVFGYDSGASAKRALYEAWAAGKPTTGARRAMDAEMLLSPIRKFRESRATKTKWSIPKSWRDILEMYTNPAEWKPRSTPGHLKLKR